MRLHGIQLGRAHDLLLDAVDWRAVGFEVQCGDDAERFLPFSTAHVIGESLKPRGVRVTRLARGVPIGSELEYVDLGTIAHALADRR